MDDLINIIIKYRWEIAGTLAMAFIIAYLADLNSRKSTTKGNVKEFITSAKIKKADKYYQAPAQLGFGKPNKEILEAINELIKKVKGL